MSFYDDVRKFSYIQHRTGKQFNVGGYRRDPEDANDKKYAARRYQSSNLPPKVDLRSYLTTVEQQGDLNSCTANAMAGAYEYLAMRQLGTSGDVSRLFIYYNARHLDGSAEEDEGTYLRNCIKTLQQYGACLEKTWPYHPQSVFHQPHENAYDEAARFLIEDAERIDIDLYAMKHCLAEGYPFAFGLQLFSSFDQAENKGRVPMPDPENEEHYGGHAMLCVGYSDKDKMFVVRNSWGTDWGNEGYCYIPYAYMTNPEYNSDCWTIRSVTDLDFSEGVWQEEGSFFDQIIPLVAEMLTIEDDLESSDEETEVSDEAYDNEAELSDEDEDEDYEEEEDTEVLDEDEEDESLHEEDDEDLEEDEDEDDEDDFEEDDDEDFEEEEE